MAARAVSKAAKDVADPARMHAREPRTPVDVPPNPQIPPNGRSAVKGIARPDRDQMAPGAAVIHARKAAGNRVRIKRVEKASAGPDPARKGVAHKVRTAGIGAVDRPKAKHHAAMGLPSLHARRTTLVVTDQALLVVHAMADRKPGSRTATHTSSHRMVRGLHSVNRNAARPRPIHETAGIKPGNSSVLSLSSNRKARRMTLASPSANINVATSAHSLHKPADLRCGSTIHSRLSSTTVVRMVELVSPNAANSARESASVVPRCGSRTIITTTSIRRIREQNPALCNTIPKAVMAA